MAKNPRKIQTQLSRKHLARLERERRQTRLIVLGAIVVIIVVVGLISYGVLSESVLKALQPVAIVNGDRITTRDFQGQTRYQRQGLIGNAVNTYQFVQLFGDSPETQASIAGQLIQAQSQLEPTTMGQQVLNQMIQNVLVRQEAERRGITVSEEEIEKAFREAFGYTPEGTATPKPTLVQLPTSTLSGLQMTLVPPTATPTETPIPTATSTPTMTVELTPTPVITPTQAISPTVTPTTAPSPTPTEYTLEGYQEQYKQTIDNFNESIGFSEKDLRRVVEDQLLRERVMEAVLNEQGVKPEEEQVWARHILVADEATAKLVLDRLNTGEDWYALAAQFSTDTSNKDKGGDLGWFSRGAMVAEFEEAAYALEVGEISQPVQTSFGYHIIQVLGHEMRSLSDSAYSQLRETKFQEWLDLQRENSTVEIRDYWVERVPAEPTLPVELTTFIQQVQQQLQQPAQSIETPAP